MDPLTAAALAMAAGSVGLKMFGPDGEYERTGGPSDGEVNRTVRSAEDAYRTGRIRSAREGARTAMQAGAGRVARSGGGRSGAFGSVAGNVGAHLGRDMGEIEAGATGMGSKLRADLMSQRRYEYAPSWSEQTGAYLGQGAALLGQGAVLKSALAPTPSPQANGGMPFDARMPSMGAEASRLSGADTDPFDGAQPPDYGSFEGPPLNARTLPDDAANFAAWGEAGQQPSYGDDLLDGPWDVPRRRSRLAMR